jgi:probable HAF family extracellular repeat protein
MRRVSAAAALVLWLLLPALAAGEAPGPSFRGVGDAPGGDFLSKAYGVSANGRFVVGATEVDAFGGNDSLEAFRWEDGELETLGWFAQLRSNCVLSPSPCSGGWAWTTMSEAFAVSTDGSVVGRICTGTAPANNVCAAARFGGSSPVAIQPEVHLLDDWTDWLDGAASDITADGSAIYGRYVLVYLEWLDNYGGIFRRQDSSTTVLGSEHWDNGIYGGVKVSPDGGAYAFNYTDYWGGYLILNRFGEATDLGPGWVGDVSKLGLVVVGQSSSQAARWHGGSVTLLGDLPGGAEQSEARAVSDAGHVIAGWGTTAAGQEAFLWTPESGMRRLADVLSEYGLDLSGWTLEQATGLSASGRTIVGWGTNPSGDTEGFVATLPARVIPAPSLGPVGLVLLVATLIAAASAAVLRGQRQRQRKNASPATR